MTELPEGANPREYVVTALINTATDWWDYQSSNETALAYDIALVFTVEAGSATQAAEAAFIVGNRNGRDADGKAWPAWCRSLSVGDVLLVRGWDADEHADL